VPARRDPAQHRLEWEGTSYPLPFGVAVTFGRGSDRDVRLPNDAFVSRAAGAVTAFDTHLLIENASRTRPFVLRAPVGEDREVGPGDGTATFGLPVFAIVLQGQHGAQYVIEARGPAGSAPAADPDGVATTAQPFPLTATQRAVVAALCRPMLVRNGVAAVPATYQEIAEALRLDAGYVRNVVRRIRDEATAVGIPGLAADPGAAGGADFRLALARLAIRNGWALDAEQPA